MHLQKKMAHLSDPKTLANYGTLLAYQSGLSICKEVIAKTSGRHTVENSLISAMVLLCTVA